MQRIKLHSAALSETHILHSVWYLLLICTIWCFVPVPFQLLLYINFDLTGGCFVSLDFLPVQSSVSHGNEKQMLLSKPYEEYITSKSQ